MQAVIKERGILFSAPMVLALLAGKKTMTRRIIKPQPESVDEKTRKIIPFNGDAKFLMSRIKCPWSVGMQLWVRETFADVSGMGFDKNIYYAADVPPQSEADENRKAHKVKWRPSLFMPRAASRITLEITDIRVERLKDISEDDARAEGVTQIDGGGGSVWPSSRAAKIPGSYRQAFQVLWESINGAGSWDKNPWLRCITFRKLS